MTAVANIILSWLATKIASWFGYEVEVFKQNREIESDAKSAADAEKNAQTPNELDKADGDLISGR